jgi:hypothetical protein
MQAAFCLLVACGSDAVPLETAASSAAPPGSLLAMPDAPLPSSFASVGLYAKGVFGPIPNGVLPYEPAYPLWSDGLEKKRFIAVPSGTIIDNQDGSQFEFPVGTLFFKTFTWRDSNGLEKPVETRVLRRTAQGWEYGAYQWNERGTEATLLPLDQPVPVSLTDNKGTFTHQIPSRIECRSCHESGLVPVLGFTEFQLTAHDDAAGRELYQPLFRYPLQDQKADWNDQSPQTKEIVGYFQGNCVSCHNGQGGPSGSFDLRPAVALNHLVNVRTNSSATASGVRIVPGKPEQSILYLAMATREGRGGTKPMPPLGIARADEEALEKIRQWIASLR